MLNVADPRFEIKLRKGVEVSDLRAIIISLMRGTDDEDADLNADFQEQRNLEGIKEAPRVSYMSLANSCIVSMLFSGDVRAYVTRRIAPLSGIRISSDLEIPQDEWFSTVDHLSLDSGRLSLPEEGWAREWLIDNQGGEQRLLICLDLPTLLRWKSEFSSLPDTRKDIYSRYHQYATSELLIAGWRCACIEGKDVILQRTGVGKLVNAMRDYATSFDLTYPASPTLYAYDNQIRTQIRNSKHTALSSMPVPPWDKEHI